MKNQHKINRENYEIFFLDYSEGNLSKEDALLLFQFLDEHPDLKVEFKLFVSENIEPLKPDEDIVFEGVASLKKTGIVSVGNINESNYENFFIAFYEGDLSESEQDGVVEFVEKNPLLKVDFEQFGKVVLQPDKKIVFDKKSSLHQTRKMPFYRILYYSAASVAAVFVLFFLFKTYFKPVEKPVEREFVQIENDTLHQQPIEIDEEIIHNQQIAETPTVPKVHEKPLYHKKERSEWEKTIITKLELIECEYIVFNPTPIRLEYRNEAEQLALDMAMAKMMQEQQKSQIDEPEETGSNFWTSLFYAVEKTAISTRQFSGN